jgi:hypothetical protein
MLRDAPWLLVTSRSGHQDLKPELPLDLPLKSRAIAGLAFELGL